MNIDIAKVAEDLIIIQSLQLTNTVKLSLRSFDVDAITK
jgi:hypothetical protein